MKKGSNIIYTIALAVLVAVSVSCTEYFDSDPTQGNPNEALVRLSIRTPQTTAPNANTRATVEAENLISSVNVLVFVSNGTTYEYRYMVEAQNVSSTDASTSFTAMLTTSTDNIKLMLLANAGVALQSTVPVFGQSEAAIKQMLAADFTSKLSGALPMWGEVSLPSGITANGANISATLLRSVARVDVVKTLGVGSNDLSLESAYLFRTNNKIQVIPTATIPGSIKVSAASIPSGSAFNSASIYYDQVAVESNGVESIRKMYLPEAASNVADRLQGVTSVIVGGYFNTDTELSYYRIDFDPQVIDHPFGQVLRNHRYTFNIVKVLGRGWSSPEAAANNISTNVTVTIESWSDFTTDMIFDWEHHFGVSSRSIHLSAPASSTSSIAVDTDISNYTIEWASQAGVGLGSEVGAGQTTSNGNFSVAISPNGKTINFTALTSNAGQATIRTDYILVRAN